MASEKDFKDLKKAVCLLLDHAVWDEERTDECANAVDFARNVIRRFPNKETQAAMIEGRK